MLQRLTHKTPSPVRVLNNNYNFFNKDGKLKDYVLSLCHELKINPADLQQKTLADFQGPDVPENIQVLRFNNYETRRQARFEMIRSILQQQNPGKKSIPRIMAFPSPGSYNNLAVVHEMPSPMKDIRREGSINDKKGAFFFTEITINKGSKAGSDGISTPRINWDRSRSRPNIEPLTPIFNDRARENRSDSAENLLKNHSVKTERIIEFEKALDRKKRNQEKACMISRAMMEQGIEYKREKRENWEEKKERLEKALENKNKQYNNKAMQIENTLKETADRYHEIQKSDEKSRKDLYRMIDTKIRDTVRRKQEFIDDRTKKLNDFNKLDGEKHQICLQRRRVYELQSTPSLSDIETRIALSQKRAQSNRSSHHRLSVDFVDKLKKVREDDESIKDVALQKTIEKMLRTSTMVFSPGKLNKNSRMIGSVSDRQMEHTIRMTAIKEDESEAEKRLLDEINEKNMRSSQHLEGKKAMLDNFIAERRELWMQKIAHLKDSQHIMAEASERQYGEKSKKYKFKVNQIMSEREMMKNKREKVQISGRLMFEERYKGLTIN